MRSRVAISLALVASACSKGPPPKPPGPSKPPQDLIAEGDGAGCREASLRRFTDRHRRFSFCAPAGSTVGWFHTVEGGKTVEQMWFAPDDSANFSVGFISQMSSDDLGPGKPPEGGEIDFDEETKLAGRKARHFRMRWHDRRERSSAIDEHGRHYHEEASDHDVVVERWSLAFESGVLFLTLRTQENTSDSVQRLFERMQTTFRFEK